MSTIGNSLTEKKFITLSSSLAFDIALSSSYLFLVMAHTRPDVNWDSFTMSDLLTYIKIESDKFYSGNLGGLALDAMNDILGIRKKGNRELLKNAKKAFCEAGEMIESLAEDIQSEQNLSDIESMIQAIEELIGKKITISDFKKTYLEGDMNSFWQLDPKTKYDFKLSHSDSVLLYDFEVTVFHEEAGARLDYEAKTQGANKFTTLFEHRAMSGIANSYALAYCKRRVDFDEETTP